MTFHAYHVPQGDPCTKCGERARAHRVDHTYEGPETGPCVKCGLDRRNHRKHRTDLSRTSYIGIDGEGQGRRDHRYVLLGAATDDGSRKWALEPGPDRDRISTVQALDFLLTMPTKRTKIFSFSFNYDLTMMLRDLDDASLFKLFRPEHPERKRCGPDSMKGPRPVIWGDYCLNLQGTKFTVRKGKKRVVVWDLFKFFGIRFVSALRDWKVGTDEILDRMQAMKDQRSDFDKLDPQAVKDYCLEECVCIGQLARKLIDAHEAVELKLRTYYGAGSSGAAMLTAMGIKEKLAPTPEAMRHAVSCAFSGGRFENSMIGSVNEPLKNWDISSAYPYQLAFLPCLLHGSWEHITKRRDLDKAENQNGALVRYSLGPNNIVRDGNSWGPFPFRTEDGSISYPVESGGGWVWRAEYLTGERLFSNVRFEEAWIYRANCNCKPFEQIAKYYVHRLKIGKEGPGLVIKLGVNSCYGKLAQSIGNALFNSWIWAGMITSGCRAQLLELMGLHEDRSDVLMMATDGLVTRNLHIKPPVPLPTNTDVPIFNKKKGIEERKPLGGWECKDADKGYFFARPGIYFPLDPTSEELETIRARGVGRSVVLRSWKKITEAWENQGVTGIAVVDEVSRFCGAKTSISFSRQGYKRAAGVDGKPAYGQWISRKVELSFDPMPKRAGVNPDGRTLTLRKFPSDLQSAPYDRAVMMHNAEARELRAATQEMLEQPDTDLSDYDEGEAA